MAKPWLVLGFGLAVLVPGCALAAEAPSFAGKTITYIVATSPGGGYDTYGRLIARYLEKYLKGSRVLVRNVPGAGNIIGANEIYAAKPDGLTLGTFNTGLVYDQLVGRGGVRFDLTKFSWIGKAESEARGLLIAAGTPFKSFDDVLKSKTPIKFATSGIGAASYFEARILANALHINAQLINNYTGNEAEMSMMRGEIAAQVGAVDSLTSFVDNGHGFWAVLLSGGPRVLPEVPRAASYVKDARGRKLLALLQTLAELGRLTAGPPKIPGPVLKAERDAMTALMNDPEFLAEARKLGLPIEYLPGAVVARRIDAALAQPPETITMLKEAASGD
jgi:putative tricarboxylic transport membrane protein